MKGAHPSGIPSRATSLLLVATATQHVPYGIDSECIKVQQNYIRCIKIIMSSLMLAVMTEA